METRVSPASQDAEERRRFRFPRRCRLRTSREFRLCYGHGVRVQGALLLLVVRANGLGFSRLGLSIPGKFGDSPRRNRMKRICREAFRLERERLPRGLDLVVVGARSREAVLPGLAEAREQMVRLADQALQRLEKRPQRSGKRRP